MKNLTTLDIARLNHLMATMGVPEAYDLLHHPWKRTFLVWALDCIGRSFPDPAATRAAYKGLEWPSTWLIDRRSQLQKEMAEFVGGYLTD